MADQENQWKRDLQQAKNNSPQADDPPPEEKEEFPPMEPELLTTPHSAPPYNEPINEKEAEKSPAAAADKINEGATEKIRSLTAQQLSSSWMQVIGSLGIAFWAWIYIGIHYIMAYIGGPFATFFPKPGREWVKPYIDKAPVPQKMKKWAEETTGQALEYFELMFASCCCGSCLILILAVLFFGWIFASPCNTMEATSSALFGIAKTFGICKGT